MYPVALTSERLNTRVFTQGEFDRSGRLERLLIHMLDPQFHLNPTEERQLSELTRVYELIGDKISRAESIQAIINDFQCTRAHAANLFADSSRLYGQMLRVDKKYDRAVIREKLARLAEKAETADDLAESRKCYEAIVKLDALHEHEDEDAKPATDTAPTQVVFTSVTKTLELSK
jgi:hypothetical protein